MLRTISLSILLVLAATSVQAASLWDKTKAATGSAVDVVGDTAKSVGSAISGDEEDPAALRAKIDQSAAEAISRLSAQNATAKERYEGSVAYAVFDTRKLSLLITTGFGSGVAVDRESGERIYMKMATGGLNLGYGVQSFQVVFLFPDRATFTDFVENGWTADAEASAAANQDSEDAAMRLKNGVSVYKLNEKGLVLSATLSGTKYWKDDDLNR
jgi:lipid-binding SYLF domain-containing protein